MLGDTSSYRAIKNPRVNKVSYPILSYQLLWKQKESWKSYLIVFQIFLTFWPENGAVKQQGAQFDFYNNQTVFVGIGQMWRRGYREAGGGLMNREETDKSCLDSQTGTTECTFPTILLIACIKNDIYVMCKKRQKKVFNWRFMKKNHTVTTDI